jgi:AcrR family transcriptional regulator
MTERVKLVTKRPRMTPRDPGRRDRILSAAYAALAAGGLRGLRTEAVAAAASVSKGAVFLEFPTKEALVAAVVEQILAASRARYMAEVLPIEAPLLRLAATLRFVFREREREPVFDHLLREDPDLKVLRGYADQPDQRQRADAELAMIRAWLAEGMADGTVRSDLSIELTPYVLSLLRFCHDHVGAATADRAPRAAVLDSLVDLFVAGLATEAGRKLLNGG